MLSVVAAFSLLILGLSTYGLVKPGGYVAFARRIAAGPGIWGASLLRLVLAVALWLAAPASAAPQAFRVLAVLALIGAAVLPVLGQERFGRLVEWGAAQPAWILRALCLVGIVFGGFLLGASLRGLALL